MFKMITFSQSGWNYLKFFWFYFFHLSGAKNKKKINRFIPFVMNTIQIFESETHFVIPYSCASFSHINEWKKKKVFCIVRHVRLKQKIKKRRK